MLVTQNSVRDFTIPSESGTYISCTTFKPSTNRPLKRIFVAHELGESKAEFSREFGKTFSALGYEVITFNFYGHGYPLLPGHGMEKFTLKKSTQDLQSVIKYLGISESLPSVIFGSSYGGLAALNVAGDNDFCQTFGIQKLILRSPLTDGARWAMLGKEGFRPFIEASRITETQIESMRGAISTSFGRGKSIPLGLEIQQEILDFNRQTFLEKVKLPVLIMHGTLDRAVPLRLTKEAAEILENCTVIELDGKGHSWTLDDLIELSQFDALESFIR